MNTWMAIVFAFNAQFDSGLNHRAVPDKLVKEGTVQIQTRDHAEESDFFQTRIQYHFVIETLFSRKVRKGEETFTLPSLYKDEMGYLDLESQKRYEDENVLLVHQGRKDWKSYSDCHFVKLVPKYKDTWDGQYFYCPEAPKSGIVELRFRVKNIPFIGEHTITSRWEDSI